MDGCGPSAVVLRKCPMFLPIILISLLVSQAHVTCNSLSVEPNFGSLPRPPLSSNSGCFVLARFGIWLNGSTHRNWTDDIRQRDGEGERCNLCRFQLKRYNGYFSTYNVENIHLYCAWIAVVWCVLLSRRFCARGLHAVSAGTAVARKKK